MSGCGEKRLTIAVLDENQRLFGLSRDVPESQVGENAVVVPADTRTSVSVAHPPHCQPRLSASVYPAISTVPGS